MRCSKCGNDNIDGNLYCSSCGEALTASETPIEKPEVVQPVQKPKKTWAQYSGHAQQVADVP